MFWVVSPQPDRQAYPFKAGVEGVLLDAVIG